MIHRALIVDDHPIVRDAMMTTLGSLGVFDSMLTSSSYEGMLEILSSDANFQILILDLSLSDRMSIDGISDIRVAYPGIPILIFSGIEDVDIINRAFEQGVHGFVSKEASMSVLISAIKLVLSGEYYIPRQAMNILANELDVSLPASEMLIVEPEVKLSPKQRQVFSCLMKGLPNKIIAENLDMAEGTVKTHLHNIYQVLRVRSRSQAILRANELGLH